MIFATRKIRVFLLVGGLLSLSGCSLFNIGDSHFICDDPDNVTGVTCKTPTAVYKSTNGPLEVTAHDLPAGMTMKEYKAQKAAKVSEQTIMADNSAIGASGSAGSYPLPVRSAAQVMRIWIAPWIDKADDYHMPGYLYTEVTPRKWNIGESEFAGNGVSIPHRVTEVAASAPANNAIGAAPTPRASAYDSSPMNGANNLGNPKTTGVNVNEFAQGMATPSQGNRSQSLTVPTSPNSLAVPAMNLGD